MKALNLFFCLLLIAILSNSSAQNTWIQKTDFAGNVIGNTVGFSINGNGYVGTGVPGLSNTFWEYDPASNAWTQIAGLPGEGREEAIAFSIGNKGYVGLGLISDCCTTDDFWEYDAVNNSWTQKANFAGGKRAFAFAFSIGTKGYVGAGGNIGFKEDFWEYDPVTDTWTKKAKYGGGKTISAKAFTIGNKAYVGTGRSDTGEYKKDFWEYDPNIDSWIQKEDFAGAPRYGSVGFSLNSMGYLGLGAIIDSSFADIWLYDPATDSWTYQTDFPSGPSSGAIALTLNSQIHIGIAAGKEWWQYIPDCTTPTGLTTTNIKSTSAKVNWNVEPTAQTYSVRYRKTGTTQWTKITAPLNYKKLSGLIPNTQYDWTVKSVCDAVNNVSSDWNATQNFTTKPLKLEGENDDDEISIEVFPNPASTTITLSLPSNQNTTLSIFNLLGEKVKEEKVTGTQITLDVSSLSQGLYLVRTENGVVGKFVKE